MRGRPIAVLMLAMLLLGVAVAQSDKAKGKAKAKGKGTVQTVTLKNAQGAEIGSASISGNPSGQGVSIKLNLKDLPAGEHALHFHQNPQCDAPAFTTAGPHFNPEGKKHGLQNPEGAHAGDMNNFTASAKGAANATIKNDHVTLGEGPNSLLGNPNGGVALVVHAKADDMKTDPAGNAGDRIACGVLKQQQ